MKNLGKVGEDKITGFKGIITSVHIYLTGCNQYCLLPRELGADGQPQKTQYFDTGRVEVYEDVGISPESVTNTHNGGPERERPGEL